MSVERIEGVSNNVTVTAVAHIGQSSLSAVVVPAKDSMTKNRPPVLKAFVESHIMQVDDDLRFLVKQESNVSDLRAIAGWREKLALFVLLEDIGDKETQRRLQQKCCPCFSDL